MATLDIVTTRPTGDSHADGKAYFETDTNQFIVWDATDGEWIQLDSDGTGSYAFNITSYATEQDVADIGLTNTVTEGDLVYARETDSLYVANADRDWLKFTYDS
jgi:hypothetical protein